MIEIKHKTNKPVVTLLLVLFLVIVTSFYIYNDLNYKRGTDTNELYILQQQLSFTTAELQKEKENNAVLAAKLKELSHLEKIQKDVVRAWDGGKN